MEFHGNIWNQHEKCIHAIQYSLGRVGIREINCSSQLWLDISNTAISMISINVSLVATLDVSVCICDIPVDSSVLIGHIRKRRLNAKDAEKHQH